LKPPHVAYTTRKRIEKYGTAGEDHLPAVLAYLKIV